MLQVQPKSYICFPEVTPAIAAFAKDIINNTSLFDLESELAKNDPMQTCKRSQKGCQKRFNQYTALDFMSVLRNEKPLKATNRGFLYRQQHLYRTEINKKGPSFRYTKRIVLPDGISTIPLPEPKAEVPVMKEITLDNGNINNSMFDIIPELAKEEITIDNDNNDNAMLDDKSELVKEEKEITIDNNIIAFDDISELLKEEEPAFNLDEVITLMETEEGKASCSNYRPSQ